MADGRSFTVTRDGHPIGRLLRPLTPPP
ncbi:hypothetical protein [Streptomyces albidoflavus]